MDARNGIAWHSRGSQKRAQMIRNAAKLRPNDAPLHVIRDVLLDPNLGDTNNATPLTRKDLGEQSFYFTITAILATQRQNLSPRQQLAMTDMLGRLHKLASAAQQRTYALIRPPAFKKTQLNPEDAIRQAYKGYIAAGVTNVPQDELTVYQCMIRMWTVKDIAQHIQNIVRGHPDKVVAGYTRTNFWQSPRKTVDQRLLELGPDNLGASASQRLLSQLQGPCTDPFTGTKRPFMIDPYDDGREPYRDPIHNFGIHVRLDLNHAYGTNVVFHNATGHGGTDGFRTIYDYHYVCCGGPLGSPGCLIGAPDQTKEVPLAYPWFGDAFSNPRRLEQLRIDSETGAPTRRMTPRIEAWASVRQGTLFRPRQDMQLEAHETMRNLVVDQRLGFAMAWIFTRMRTGRVDTMDAGMTLFEETVDIPYDTVRDMLDAYATAFVRFNRVLYPAEYEQYATSVADMNYERMFRVRDWGVAPVVPAGTAPLVPPGPDAPDVIPDVPDVIPDVTLPKSVAPYIPRIVPLLLLLDVDKLIQQRERDAVGARISVVKSVAKKEMQSETVGILERLETYINSLLRHMEYVENVNDAYAELLDNVPRISSDETNDQLVLLYDTIKRANDIIETGIQQGRDMADALNPIVETFNRIYEISPDVRTQEHDAELVGLNDFLVTYTNPIDTQPLQEMNALLVDDADRIQMLVDYAKRVVEWRKQTTVSDTLVRMERMILKCGQELIVSNAMAGKGITQDYLDKHWNTKACQGALSELIADPTWQSIKDLAQRNDLYTIGQRARILGMVDKSVLEQIMTVDIGGDRLAFRKWVLVTELPENVDLYDQNVFYIPSDENDITTSDPAITGILMAFIQAYFVVWANLLVQENKSLEFRQRTAERLDNTSRLADKLRKQRRDIFESRGFVFYDFPEEIPDLPPGPSELPPGSFDVPQGPFQPTIVHGLYQLDADELDMLVIRIMSINSELSALNMNRSSINSLGEFTAANIDNITWSSVQLQMLTRFKPVIESYVRHKMSTDQRITYLKFLRAVVDLMVRLGNDAPKELVDLDQRATEKDVFTVSEMDIVYRLAQQLGEQWYAIYDKYTEEARAKKRRFLYILPSKTFKHMDKITITMYEMIDNDLVDPDILDYEVSTIRRYIAELEWHTSQRNLLRVSAGRFLDDYARFTGHGGAATTTLAQRKGYAEFLAFFTQLMQRVGDIRDKDLGIEKGTEPTMVNVGTNKRVKAARNRLERAKARLLSLYVPETPEDLPEADEDLPEADEDLPEADEDLPEADEDLPEAVPEEPISIDTDFYMTPEQRQFIVKNVFYWFRDQSSLRGDDMETSVVSSAALQAESTPRFAVLRNMILSGSTSTSHFLANRRQFRGLSRRQFEQLELFVLQSGFWNPAIAPQDARITVTQKDGQTATDTSLDQLNLSWGILPNASPDSDVNDVRDARSVPSFAQRRVLGLPAETNVETSETVFPIAWVRWAAREMRIVAQALLIVTDNAIRDTNGALALLEEEMRQSQKTLSKIRRELANRSRAPAAQNESSIWKALFSSNGNGETIPQDKGKEEEEDDNDDVDIGPGETEDDADDTEELEEIGIDELRQARYIHTVVQRDAISEHARLLREYMKKPDNFYQGVKMLQIINQSVIGTLLATLGNILQQEQLGEEQRTILYRAGVLIGAYDPTRKVWITTNGWGDFKLGDIPDTSRGQLLIPRLDGDFVKYNIIGVQQLIRAWALFAEILVFVTSQKAHDWSNRLDNLPDIADHLERIQDGQLRFDMYEAENKPGNTSSVYRGSDNVFNPNWQPIGVKVTRREAPFSLRNVHGALMDIDKDTDAWLVTMSGKRVPDLDQVVHTKYIRPILTGMKHMLGNPEARRMFMRYVSLDTLKNMGVIQRRNGRYRLTDGLTTRGTLDGTVYMVGTIDPLSGRVSPFPVDAQVRLLYHWAVLAAILDEVTKTVPDTSRLAVWSKGLTKEWRYQPLVNQTASVIY